MSCDLLDTERPGAHYKGDVRDIIDQDWDLMICHSPCTHLSVSGARWFKEKKAEQSQALDFVRYLLDAPIPRIALENPISIISSHIRPPTQVIQPWQFGHGEVKGTCLWLKNLPKLIPTTILGGDLFTPEAPAEREARVHKMPPGPDRWKERFRTFTGIANAMAEQWT
jgi:site-specific DNA-cytosine methylase